MSQHRSVWLATAERPTYPRLDGDLAVDVAVVGGGITGLTTALMLQRDGADVAVIEAERAGDGTTGYTTGKVTSQHSLCYDALAQRHGEPKARLYAEANQEAIETIRTLVADTQVDCQLERAAAFVYAETAEHRHSIEREHEVARRLGLPATLTTETDLPFPVEVALRFDDQAHLHAGRYIAGLARTLVQRGGHLFEGSRAQKIDERGEHAVVRAPDGDVRAKHVVLATLLPFADRGGFFAKARPSRAYGVAAQLRGDAPTGMHINVGSPIRSTRPWFEGNRPGLIVVGENHATGERGTTPAHWAELERWARMHFEVESFEYRWSSQDFMTADGLPYVGRSPRMQRTFVATGFNKWGLTNGTAAAHVLADLVAGRESRWLEAFDATRIGGAATVGKLVEANLHVAKRLVGDRLGRRRAEPLSALQPGEGGMFEVDGKAVGAYRDADGTLHAVSLTCSHMGCTLQWNGAETSWDCPCHGSRFDPNGAVLDGPAVRPLAPVHVDAT